MRIAIAVLALGTGCFGQTPAVSEIMARVAENQTRALESRKDFVYHQKQLLRMIRGNKKIAREERREYTVTPKQHGSTKDLTHFEGTYEQKGKYVAYNKPGYEYKDVDIDGDLINDLSNDLMGDDKSKDGISKGLFPLTPEEQRKYQFKLLASEQYRGRPVYRVAFEPRPRAKGEDWDDDLMSLWKGEALIDAEEFQPVMVNSKLAKGIPMAVKILLGTNIKGLGFSVAYQKFGDGVWFPVSYGGEFEVRALFLYKRTMTISMANSDFRRVDVASKIAYDTEGK